MRARDLGDVPGVQAIAPSPLESYPVEHNAPVNAQILAVSEDKISGFVREPFQEIAVRSGVALEEVLGRIRAMLAAGTIRRSIASAPSRFERRVHHDAASWRQARLVGDHAFRDACPARDLGEAEPHNIARTGGALVGFGGLGRDGSASEQRSGDEHDRTQGDFPSGSRH